jgi:hypothetical protein
MPMPSKAQNQNRASSMPKYDHIIIPDGLNFRKKD